ncbi:hypothetical protein Ssi03_76070 [Sphaerisporangium siamense]|uniref:Siphovirus-type tail component C-terminal domain-containing protein n=1 Tax=Sphaerisporangium siamense TaxID=795645 RepID=A0A7W7D5E7_9ACTN|nr:phage tail domain-containing protein [Sphaerisporangium siamense]MBB4699288.1 hypothetical protein [Sphaerisporangium siamense]GII89617.1 hypothetical protein Ssi03_76070 [Sphaerisporangium siamense]
MAGELIAGDWDIDWDGFLIGTGTPYTVVQLDGWLDSPPLVDRSVPRPSRHGSWAGRPRAQARTVTAIVRIVAERSAMGDAVHALRAATGVARDATEAPLAIRALGQTLVAFGKFANRLLSVDQLFAAGVALAVPLQWRCADPRLYELAEQSATIGAPTGGSGGLTYPLTYPLSYGTPAGPATATCVNTGNEATNPVLVFTGPITTPRMVNSTLGRSLEFDLDLPAGQTLTVDTDAGTVLLNGTTDRLYKRTGTSVPVEYFELAPGPNNLTLFGAALGVGAQVQVTWRSAYL